MKASERGAKVSVFSRVLAAGLAAATAFAIVLFVLSLGQQEKVVGSGDPLEMLFLVIGAPLLFVASAFVAITGRSPRWMTNLEDAHDKRTRSHREAAQSVEDVRRLARLGAAVTCGVSLIVLGFIFNVFSSGTPWVGIGIFSIAWVVTVALIWRYFGKRIPGDRSHK
jgi:hypothetical protein